MLVRAQALGLLVAAAFAVIANAQPAPPDLCGTPFNPAPVVLPKIYAALVGSQSDAAFDCLMWQSFIHLNWPSRGNAPGEPDPAQPFGSLNPTVWETYKPYDQVFLPNGTAPGPWAQRSLSRSPVAKSAASVASGETRLLLQATKFSPAAVQLLPPDLREIIQVRGGVLVDQAGQPVYYEMLVNEDAYNYIVRNGLYAAQTQLAFAQQQGILLPIGATSDGPIGAIELKAAWKIMTPAELAGQRFHTRPALLADGTQVTVGLVGLHVYQRLGGFHQGVWATFSQIDNSPVTGRTPSGTYSFFNTACGGCTANAMTQPPTPTQVVRMFAARPDVQRVNEYVQQLIRAVDQSNPFQYYELVGVQWPESSIPIGSPRQPTPLPNGSPNTGTMINPVLETFLQTPNMSCLGCHVRAGTAQNGALATSYSFLFSHAQ